METGKSALWPWLAGRRDYRLFGIVAASLTEEEHAEWVAYVLSDGAAQAANAELRIARWQFEALGNEDTARALQRAERAAVNVAIFWYRELQKRRAAREAEAKADE